MEHTETKQEVQAEVKTEAPKFDKETQTLLEAENIKLKQTLGDLHYKNAGFKDEHKEWIQTILEKENKHLYDENINDVLKDKKYDIFRASKSDTSTTHAQNVNADETKQENKQKPLTDKEIDNIQIFIPGIDK